jgi:rhodanese-related sulfurtransferase
MFRKILQVFILITLVGTLTACSGTQSDNTVNPEGAVIIDVRTPQEYASGHLEGSVNIDINAADFEENITALDPIAKYLIYCRSGNRSAQAIERMRGLGFTNMVDLGSIESAATSTGVEVIR